MNTTKLIIENCYLNSEGEVLKRDLSKQTAGNVKEKSQYIVREQDIVKNAERLSPNVSNGRIAICVPTCRPDLYSKTFIPAWKELFAKHGVKLLTTIDADKSEDIILSGYGTAKEIMGKEVELIYPRNAGHKLLAFYYIAKQLPDIEYIICLDDDVTPVGDPIQDHIDALNMRVPISWMPVGTAYTRGVPYDVRSEAEVVLSHGVWDGVPDLDAPTQLILGDKPQVDYFKMPIPKGVLYPMSEMNIAFKRKLLPYMYFAPTCDGVYGADDIWAGIESKRMIDKNGWAAVTGYSRVYHERASNKFNILIKQGLFIKYNETYWKQEPDEPYFKVYKEKRERWEELISKMI